MSSQVFEAFVIEPYSWEIESKNEIKSVIRVPVVLASELIQHYASYELPPAISTVLRDKGIDFVPVLKPYDALKRAIRSKERIPIIINHSSWDYTDENTIGYVQELKADDAEKKIKGVAYLIKSKVPRDLLRRIEKGEIIDVSIGGYAYYSFADDSAEDYFLVQDSIEIEHLAILPDTSGRCPSGICGLNLDSMNADDKILAYSDIIAHTQHRPTIVSIKRDYTDRLPENILSLKNTGFIKLLLDLYNRGYIMPDEAVLLKQIEDLRKQLESKDIEIARLRDASVKNYEAKLRDRDTKIDALEKVIQGKDEAIKELEAKLADAEAKIKGFEESMKSAIIDELVSLKYDSRENLEKVCLHDLKVIRDTVRKFTPVADRASIVKTYGFDKPQEKGADELFGITINLKEDVKDGV